MAGADATPTAPILFLDIDGVLNKHANATHIQLDADLVDRLRVVVEQTRCQIVLSTFWRHFEDYIRYMHCREDSNLDRCAYLLFVTVCLSRCACHSLHRHNIDAATVIGRTPGVSDASSLANDPADATHYSNRAAEIRAWLREHPSVKRFVILDDRASASDRELAPHFVQTDARHGLTQADAERCRAILLGSAPGVGAGVAVT